MTATAARGQDGGSPAGEVEIRPLTTPEQVAAAKRVFASAMVGIPFPPEDDVALHHEPGRGLGAFDGERVVGGAEAYTSWLTVPGGTRVPHAAVTHVGVLPSHTRRGIVTALLHRQLRDVAARGEVVASLRASEATIYERFGYGAATRAASYEVSRRRGGLRASVPAGSPVRLGDRSEAESDELLQRIYERVGWTGAIGRYASWWNGRRLWLADARPAHLALSGPEGEEDGYAVYHPADSARWFLGDDRTVIVDDFVATTPAAYLGLIHHFATLDLTDAFRLPSRPVDDPLPGLFTDARSVRLLGDHDETWLRIVDVEVALAARAYGGGGSLVIGVADALLTANAGSYRVGSAGVSRTDAAPELSLDVAALGSIYLGGQRPSDLALAGRAREHREGAIADADALFAVSTAPFAGTVF